TAMTRAGLAVLMVIIVIVPLLVLGIDNVLVRYAGHSPSGLPLDFWPRGDVDTSGFQMLLASFEPWDKGASLEEVAEFWTQPGLKAISRLDRAIGAAKDAGDSRAVIPRQIMKAMLFNSEGQPTRSYEVLQEVRSLLAGDHGLERDFLYSIVYLQGVSALR